MGLSVRPPVTLSQRFRQRLGRRTTSGRLVPEIDGLRFPAIAIVVIGHLSSFYLVRGNYGYPTTGIDSLAAAPERYAREGVYLFFIISGFVLALPFARHHVAGERRVSLKSYFLRRVTRLEPPYLLSLAALCVLEIFAAAHHVAGRTGTPSEILTHFAASAAYLHSIVFGAPSTVNPPAWSLEIEIQFYTLVPLLTFLFAIRSTRWRRAAIAVSCLAAIAMKLATIDCCPRASLSLVGSLQYFLIGFLLADIYLFSPMCRLPKRFAWDVVSLLGWPMLFVLWQRGVTGIVLLPFTAFIVFLAVFRGIVTNRIFSNAWITTFGGMCYSIYLVHFEMIAAVGRAVRRFGPGTGRMWVEMLIQGPVILAVTLTTCVAFYAVVERPCMDPGWPGKLAEWVRARSTTGRLRLKLLIKRPRIVT
jgi:peptidoglycan/LPS O-acetylase OafA/YrhL